MRLPVRLARRVMASITASALTVTGAAGCTPKRDAVGADTLFIGADLDATSTVDVGYAQALQLRIDQINASGRLGGHRLALRTVDNRSDPPTSLRTVTAFGDDPTVIAVVTGACDECLVGDVKTIADKRLPTIALATADEVATPLADRRFVFKLRPDSADSAAAMVAELSRVHVTTAAILHPENLYGRGADKALAAELAKAGIKVTATRTVKPTATDLDRVVGALTGTKPGALLVLAGPEQAVRAATGARAAGYTGRVYFDAAAAGDQFVGVGPAGATNNAMMVFSQILAIDDVIATTPAKAARKQWFRDYT